MLAGQLLSTTATTALPALAPEVAADFGVSSSLIGYQISVLAAAMLVSLGFGGNLSRHWGACRVSQAALVMVAVGCLLAVVPHLAFLLMASVALGLGYGLITPSASHLLARFTSAGNRNFVFSIKQTGVPGGGVVAAAVLPSLALAIGWRPSLMILACVLVIPVSAAWPLIAAYGLFFLLGSTSSGWNGAFLAEVANLSPRHAVSSTTGGSLVIVNIGKMLGPIAFANVYLLAGGYTWAFGFLALPSAVGLACLLMAQRATRCAVAGN